MWQMSTRYFQKVDGCGCLYLQFKDACKTECLQAMNIHCLQATNACNQQMLASNGHQTKGLGLKCLETAC